MSKHLDTTRTYRPRTWAMSDRDEDETTNTNLSAYFAGANLGRKRAEKYDPTTWWAHSVQNDTPANVNVRDAAHDHLRHLIGALPLPY